MHVCCCANDWALVLSCYGLLLQERHVGLRVVDEGPIAGALGQRLSVRLAPDDVLGWRFTLSLIRVYLKGSFVDFN